MEQVFPDRYDQEFLAFIGKQELRIAVDRKTGAALGFHERGWHTHGNTTVSWQRARGRGVVLSYTVTRRPYSLDFPVPLVHALVELDEGPRLICRLAGIAPERVVSGFKVKAAFDNKGLLFRPLRAVGKAARGQAA